MSAAKHTPGPLVITPNEPEGWAKAFEVSRDGLHVVWCSFRDTAEHYVAENPDAMPGPFARAAIAKATGEL